MKTSTLVRTKRKGFSGIDKHTASNLVFRIQKSYECRTNCLSIINLKFLTDFFFFCNNPKPNWKIPLDLCQANHDDVDWPTAKHHPYGTRFYSLFGWGWKWSFLYLKKHYFPKYAANFTKFSEERQNTMCPQRFLTSQNLRRLCSSEWDTNYLPPFLQNTASPFSITICLLKHRQLAWPPAIYTFGSACHFTSFSSLSFFLFSLPLSV